MDLFDGLPVPKSDSDQRHCESHGTLDYYYRSIIAQFIPSNCYVFFRKKSAEVSVGLVDSETVAEPRCGEKRKLSAIESTTEQESSSQEGKAHADFKSTLKADWSGI